jgi:hypothetical protein
MRVHLGTTLVALVACQSEPSDPCDQAANALCNRAAGCGTPVTLYLNSSSGSWMTPQECESFYVSNCQAYCDGQGDACAPPVNGTACEQAASSATCTVEDGKPGLTTPMACVLSE